MRVVLAPDKFKGGLSASEVCAALAAGIADAVPRVITVKVPMADGGDGTVQAFLDGGATPVRATVRGPDGAPTEARFARDGATAVIEMSAASGLALLGERRLPRDATTRGTGELVRAALDGGARRIVVGIGGSATTDGGAGFLAALGVRFLDAAGVAFDPTPRELLRLDRVDATELDARVRAVDLLVACDVDNPLLGPQGAAAIYGPQKGASPEDVAFLDDALRHLADVVHRDLGVDERDRPGAGAAGGLGWALATFLGARLAPGAKIVAEVRGLAAALSGAAWCLTGEGRIDRQTLHGKVVDGVAALAIRAGARVAAFGGSIDLDAERALAARGVVCCPIATGPATLEAALADAAAHVRAAASRFARLALANA